MNYQLRYFTKEELENYVLNKNDRFLQAEFTDLVCLTGYKPNREAKCFVQNYPQRYFSPKRQEWLAFGPYDFCGMVRPVLPLEDIKIDNDVVELGLYPQWLASREETYELNDKFLSKLLEPTGLTYVLYDYYYEDSKSCWRFRRYPVYAKDDNLYIRYITQKKLIGNYQVVIRNRHFLEDDAVWVKVTPVEWLVDHNNFLLISRYCLLNGVPLNSEDSFISSGMSEDMFQVNLISEEKLQKQPLRETALSIDIEYVKEQLHLSRGISTEATSFLDKALERLDIVSDKINTSYQKVKK